MECVVFRDGVGGERGLEDFAGKLELELERLHARVAEMDDKLSSVLERYGEDSKKVDYAKWFQAIHSFVASLELALAENTRMEQLEATRRRLEAAKEAREAELKLSRERVSERPTLGAAAAAEARGGGGGGRHSRKRSNGAEPSVRFSQVSIRRSMAAADNGAFVEDKHVLKSLIGGVKDGSAFQEAAARHRRNRSDFLLVRAAQIRDAVRVESDDESSEDARASIWA